MFTPAGIGPGQDRAAYGFAANGQAARAGTYGTEGIGGKAKPPSPLKGEV